jgi:peroxiredoxin
MNYRLIYSIAIKTIVFSIILFTSACGGQSTNVSIIGTIEGAAKKLVILRDASHDMIGTVDTTQTDELGNFEFNINVLSPQFVLLQLEGEAEPIILLLAPKEEIIIKAETDSFASNYSVRGSKGSTLVNELNLRLNEVVSKIDSLSYHFRSSREDPKFDSIKAAIDSAYFFTLKSHKEYTEDFINSNRYSLASILALYQQYDKTRPVLNSRNDFELFSLVDSVLYPLYPENSLVANLHSNVNKIRKQLDLYDKREDMLTEGENVPNVMLLLLNGDSINLLDVRARYILVDFWATWCNECIPNNRLLREVYDKYSGKGFQVVQVSLDENKNDLMKIVQNDSIPWIIAVDFLQWDSPIVDSLSINSIPSNYLINRMGEIQARNLSDKELQEILSKLLP